MWNNIVARKSKQRKSHLVLIFSGAIAASILIFIVSVLFTGSFKKDITFSTEPSISFHEEIENADELNFWLGMYNQTSEEYTYDWVKDIIYNETGNVIKKDKKIRKKSIPKTIKKEVWKKYMGDKTDALCFCCNINNLNILDNYYCGHVKAEANGGDLSISNLRPICNPCNLGMGTMNLFDYKNKFYSKSSI